jgi:hypothetical protein
VAFSVVRASSQDLTRSLWLFPNQILPGVHFTRIGFCRHSLGYLPDGLNVHLHGN